MSTEKPKRQDEGQVEQISLFKVEYQLGGSGAWVEFAGAPSILPVNEFDKLSEARDAMQHQLWYDEKRGNNNGYRIRRVTTLVEYFPIILDEMITE